MIPNFSNDQTDLRQRNELFEFAKAWIGTALAFAVLYRSPSISFTTLFLITALTAGLGVILHELMHRVVARHFGATAHFVANDAMLVISILIAFGGFLFAAPGAVWHTGMLSKRQVGLIAAAGPITNMVLALLFVGALLVARGGDASPLILFGLTIGYLVNAILGVFNMLPFGPIDGAKVLSWSSVSFGVLVGIAVVIAFGLPRLIPGLPSIF